MQHMRDCAGQELLKDNAKAIESFSKKADSTA
jgi:hypothetical protein